MNQIDNAIDALIYIESYLDSAADSEDSAGLLMSAKPLLSDLREFLSKIGIQSE